MSADANLLRAAELGDLSSAEEFLNRGADVNARSTRSSENDYTPLHYAAAKGNESLVKLLLKNGAEINAIAINKITPLYLATENCKFHIVKLLLENGADVNTCDSKGKSVLYIAVENANLTMTEEILRFRPDINNEANRKSLYALLDTHTYEILNNSKIVDALLRYGFTVSTEEAEDSSLLNKAFERGFVKMVEAFLKLGADVNTISNVRTGRRNRTLLLSAVFFGQTEMTELLLIHGADTNVVDNCGHSAMWLAIFARNAAITKLLLKYSAGFKVTNSVFNSAVQQSRELVKSLLKITPDIDINACDEYGLTALHYTVDPAVPHWTSMWFPSAIEDNVTDEKQIDASEIAKILLSRGARVNAKSYNGSTPLHLAAEGGYVKVVDVLLENKADVEALTKNNETPLHSAASFSGYSNVTIVKALLDIGANINAKRIDGRTALHKASEYGQKESVKLLVERGADLEDKDINGSTPLHLAVERGHVNVVLTLVKLDVNVEAKDNSGRTALHRVGTNNGPEITNILLNHGADINVTCVNSMTPLENAEIEIDKYWNERRELEADFMIDGNDSDYDYDPCRHEEIAKILHKRIFAMTALGFYVSDENRAASDFLWEDHQFYKLCQTEIAGMKKKKIGDSDVTFYDFLTKSWDQLVNYGRNESIVKAIESEDLECDFPCYCGMIVVRLRQGWQRESLLDLSLKSFNVLFGYVLPDGPIMEIFNYLSNNDLESLIKANPGN